MQLVIPQCFSGTRYLAVGSTVTFSRASPSLSSCDEKNTQETLNPIRWKDGRKDYDQPCLLYGLRNDVLLVGRVYLCRNKHQILSHDQGILCQLRADFQPPFLLFHKIGVTRELFRFFTSHISAGMAISDVQVLWHQSLFIRVWCMKDVFPH